MEKLLSFIFTLILVFWVLRLVFRLVGPWLFGLLAKHLMKKAGFTQETAEDAQTGTSTSSKTDTVKSGKWWKPDEVILKPHRREGQRVSDILGGEYVDCQEVAES